MIAAESISTGGTLHVRHRKQIIDFAWAGCSPKAISWAAFYGDCEHDVQEVTSGHRVTLTYNLFYTSLGTMARPVSDPTNLPFYDIAKEMLQDASFMKQGK